MKHPQRGAAGTLRPNVVLNLVLITCILGVIGVAHVWLGMRRHEKERELRRLEEALQQSENEIGRLRAVVQHRSSPGTLSSQIEAMGIRLERNTDRIITLTSAEQNPPTEQNP